MATGTHIRTYFNGTWHDGDTPIISAADHGAWLGSGVFDGARWFEGLSPDLDAHCARVNRSAKALMLTPTVSAEDMVEIVREGLSAYDKSQAIYIRPMYWGIDGDPTAIIPQPDKTGFAVCLEEIPMAPPSAATTLTRTRFRREGSGTTTDVLDPTPYDMDALVPLEVAAGTCIAFHGCLPHWSAPNTSDRSRLAYTLHVIDGTADYLDDNWLHRGPDLPLRGF